jgi:serine/threonine protein kinase
MQGSEISLHGGDAAADGEQTPLPGELGYSSGAGSADGFSNDPGRASVPGPVAARPSPSSQRADDRRIGQVIDGKYHVLRRLACGGMGSVYEARHTVVGRHFALKFLHEQYAQRSCMVQRFLREAQAAGSIASEHIIGVLDYGTSEGTPYLVMELVRGQDLREILAETPRLPARRAVRIVLDACRGLALAHERGLVHRDLKPANICVTRRSDGREVAKVIDFGVAKLRDGAELSEEGTLIGTLGYMAPEQLTDQRQLDARADVYALGVILYQSLAGRPPHICNRSELLYRIVSVDPKPLAELCPELPPGLAEVVHKALCRSKERRYGSVRELAHALERFAGDEPQPGSAPTLASGSDEQRRATPAERSSGLGTAETEVGATPTWAALAHAADQKADRQCEPLTGADIVRGPLLEQYCRHPDGLPLPPPPARHHHLSQRALLLSVGALLLSVVAMTTMFVFVYSHGSGALESTATARTPARLAAVAAAERASAASSGEDDAESATALAPAELCRPLQPASVSSERAGVSVQRHALEPARGRGPAHPAAGAPGIDCE